MQQVSRSPPIKMPDISEDLAEDVGIQIGDGHIGYYGDVSKAAVEVVGNIIEDYDYIVNYVKPLKEKLFGVRTLIYEHKSAGTIVLRINSKRLLEFYKSIGLPVGNKSEVKIPDFIMKDRKMKISCIRGLFDTDGSLSFTKGDHKNYSNPRIHFVCKSKVLSIQVCKILLEFGLKYSTSDVKSMIEGLTNFTLKAIYKFKVKRV